MDRFRAAEIFGHLKNDSTASGSSIFSFQILDCSVIAFGVIYDSVCLFVCGLSMSSRYFPLVLSFVFRQIASVQLTTRDRSIRSPDRNWPPNLRAHARRAQLPARLYESLRPWQVRFIRLPILDLTTFTHCPIETMLDWLIGWIIT